MLIVYEIRFENGWLMLPKCPTAKAILRNGEAYSYNLLRDGRQEKLAGNLEAALNAEKCSLRGNYDGVYLLTFYVITSTTTFYIQIQKYCSHLHHYPAMHLLQLLL